MNTIRANLAELGLTIGAKLEDVKKAYRARAKMVHPDLVHGSQTQAIQAGQKMRLLNAAYASLKDRATATGSFHISQVFDYASWIRETASRETGRKESRTASTTQKSYSNWDNIYRAPEVAPEPEERAASHWLVGACLGGCVGALFVGYSLVMTSKGESWPLESSRKVATSTGARPASAKAAARTIHTIDSSTGAPAAQTVNGATGDARSETFDSIVRRKSRIFGN